MITNEIPVEANSIGQFVAMRHIAMTSRSIASNPLLDPDGSKMHNYEVCIKTKKGLLTLGYSKGLGHNGVPPRIEEVLDCVANDSAGLEAFRDFAEWCGDYGYDTDSLWAYAVYKAVKKQANGLKKILGVKDYEILLWKTDRL